MSKPMIPASRHRRWVRQRPGPSCTRFIQDGRIDLLNDAIGLMREAVGDTPTGSGERATCANNLGVALHDRFERTGAETDLDDAIR